MQRQDLPLLVGVACHGTRAGKGEGGVRAETLSWHCPLRHALLVNTDPFIVQDAGSGKYQAVQLFWRAWRGRRREDRLYGSRGWCSSAGAGCIDRINYG
ncbi:hypothetical protein [Pontibacter beigongshangensis]|uniref:hypothetical protein n=1 Tax=Pontibacter beigongshangensis TaxID=2574733 RepID=UPI00164F5456|nr:hypothetical protein [Pontibacter beigongshangensis]